jgi:hypothetical protein
MSFVNHGKCNVKSDNGWSYLPLVNYWPYNMVHVYLLLSLV